ncbi:MAG TPA: type VI secretion system baseplate subunit TssE [Roseiarcus sp.]
MATRENDRLTPPLMQAFRAAHHSRDARTRADVREGGERVLSSRRMSSRTPISESELRKIVISDVGALLNTVNLNSAQNLSEAPEVGKSILNFGFPDIARLSIDENAVLQVAQQLEAALRDFEPRLVRGSVKAHRDETVSPNELRVRFLVSAALRMQPVDVPVQFVAEVELDSGKLKIDRL